MDEAVASGGPFERDGTAQSSLWRKPSPEWAASAVLFFLRRLNRCCSGRRKPRLKPWPPVFPSFIVGCMLAHVRMDVDFGFSPLLESAHIRLFLIKNGKIGKNCLQNATKLAYLSTDMPNFTPLVFSEPLLKVISESGPNE